MVTDPTALLLQLAEAFESGGFRYVVGGSIASSRHGEYRATNDIDILIELTTSSVGMLASTLGEDFHLDLDAAVEAVSSGTSFSTIHLPAMVKVDFYVATDSKLHRLQLERRERVVVAPDAAPVYFASAEDTILAKLSWYRQSGGVLERQLRDVGGILKVRRGELDLAYLRHAAAILGLRDLLETSLEDAGIDQ